MPYYEFLHKPSGAVREEFFDMEDAPKLGSTLRRDGRTWTRIMSKVQLAPIWSRTFIAHSQEPGDPDAPHHVGPERLPAFTSQKECDEFAAKKGLVYRDERIGRLRGKKLASTVDRKKSKR